MSEDRQLTCADCGQSYTFTAQEQDFYAERGFQEPKRCKQCREARKARGPGGGGGGRGGYGGGGGGRREGSGRAPRGGGGMRDRGPKQLFPATCAECGVQTEVPFEPKGDRPVYCRDCFKAARDRG